MKKTIEELQQIRQKTLDKITMRHGTDGYRIVVGMATCGIASGARPVITKIMEEIDRRHIINVTVSQTGCIGMCELEPIVDVIGPDNEKITYIKVTPEKIERIMKDHILENKIVQEYTLTQIGNTIIQPGKAISEQEEE